MSIGVYRYAVGYCRRLPHPDYCRRRV